MLQIIGAGFGRTGTHSLGLALERLGYGPCYNIHEIGKNPGHSDIWTQAIDGHPIDWKTIFAEYNTTVEWPAVTFVAELVQYYPKAKIIFTLRDPQSWFESANTTIFDALELSAYNPDPVKRNLSSLQRRLILEYTFGGRHREKEYAINIYQQHIKMVRNKVPSDRILQFDVKDGWQPLCNFLNKPLPKEPFPKKNSRNEFLASTPE